jgi:hypothetical protein
MALALHDHDHVHDHVHVHIVLSIQVDRLTPGRHSNVVIPDQRGLV